MHDDGTGSGRELCRASGSLATTQLVLDIAAGQASGPIEGTLVAALGGTQLQFAASDLQNGLQLWLSNGTAATTQQVTSFGAPGYGAVHLGEFFAGGARTFFACDDGINGVEPWVYDPNNSSVAFVLPYGSACAGTPGEPVIAASGLPTIGNQSFAVTVAQALPHSLAIPVGANAPNSIALGSGCWLLLDIPLVFLPSQTTDAAGNASVGFAVPNNPALVGSSLFFQWAVLDPLGPLFGDFAVSGGLQVQVGV